MKMAEKIFVPEGNEITGEGNFIEKFNFRSVGVLYTSNSTRDSKLNLVKFLKTVHRIKMIA
jgi:hypothetical protein